jgi:GntR family transcriptional regulator, N-acetylglucosamine utilization regulator
MARFRLELGPIPLHHQVYLDLKSALDGGDWSPGDRLPTERELAARYGCSLITIRRALSELVREGRLERTRGRGTFVLPPRIDVDFSGSLSFTQEMELQGLEPETRLIAARPEAARETVAEALGLELGAPTLFIERLRIGAGQPLLLEAVHLPAERFPGLLSLDLEHGSLYDLLANRYDTEIARAREWLTPVLPPHRVAELLDLDRHHPALLIEGIAFDAEDQPVEYGRSYVRGDRSRYAIERSVVRSDRPRLAAMT